MLFRSDCSESVTDGLLDINTSNVVMGVGDMYLSKIKAMARNEEALAKQRGGLH